MIFDPKLSKTMDYSLWLSVIFGKNVTAFEVVWKKGERREGGREGGREGRRERRREGGREGGREGEGRKGKQWGEGVSTL